VAAKGQAESSPNQMLILAIRLLAAISAAAIALSF
jgi:hypothetical protein